MALVEELLPYARACVVAYDAVDVVVCDCVSRAGAVDVVREWAIGDTAVIADAIAAETGYGVEDVGGGEGACVVSFVLVSVLL